jgi:hypothetical protein
MVDVADSSATERGPQNFVDYLMYLRRMGSDYCSHWEDPAFPTIPDWLASDKTYQRP